MRDELISAVLRNHRWLGTLQVVQQTPASNEYDLGGLQDPLEMAVQGEHYSTSHFAWAGANIFTLTGDRTALEGALLAVEFTRRHLAGYPAPKWGMHFDFNNFALAAAADALESPPRPEIATALASAPRNRHTTANWCAMRAAVHYWLARNRRTSIEKAKGHIWLASVLVRQQACGIFNDHWSSASTQYHAFTGSVLSTIWREHPTTRLERALRKAAAILSDLVDADGEVLCVGRGHRQIFGYACAIHFLVFASVVFGASISTAQQVWDHLRAYQRDDGSFPLVTAPYEDKAHVGWYDYNRLTVYNAFACAWLSDAARLFPALGRVRNAS